MKRLLLLQEDSKAGDDRIRKLHETGYDVVAADSQDLFWPKFVETGAWHAIIFDQSSFMMTFVEMASELGSSTAARDIPLFLITAEDLKDSKLPSSFEKSTVVENDEALVVALEST